MGLTGNILCQPNTLQGTQRQLRKFQHLWAEFSAPGVRWGLWKEQSGMGIAGEAATWQCPATALVASVSQEGLCALWKGDSRWHRANPCSANLSQLPHEAKPMWQNPSALPGHCQPCSPQAQLGGIPTAEPSLGCQKHQPSYRFCSTWIAEIIKPYKPRLNSSPRCLWSGTVGWLVRFLFCCKTLLTVSESVTGGHWGSVLFSVCFTNPYFPFMTHKALDITRGNTIVNL